MSLSLSTCSILAHDPETGDLGAAVLSHGVALGAEVIWAAAGVGCAVIQGALEPALGYGAIEMMGNGLSAVGAVDSLIYADPEGETRQLAAVDHQGRVGSYSGSQLSAAAGERRGDGLCAQAHAVAGGGVWEKMGEAFENARGELATRLVAALEAATLEPAAAEDPRGPRSAALIVVPGDPRSTPWTRRADLRVDEHARPVEELRRLLELLRAA